ncbi:hypothetical protein [Apilactobacillus kunkeei]|uniref:hypothetical protein n=1 Tax=Apilactobacillus kunkeei TaxID=148814 RepID=UPI000B04B8EE|nr:hypothetical protein [Apilactobacillus kunkeei]
MGNIIELSESDLSTIYGGFKSYTRRQVYRNCRAEGNGGETAIDFLRGFMDEK